MLRAAWAVAAAALAWPVTAFELEWPVDCTLWQDCVIQQYPDQDPGAGAQDYRCGSLSYDGHNGTDIRLPSLAEMREGVSVRAAAAGEVAGTRDGMADLDARQRDREEIAGRECGNGVLILHADGWQTQYCHMRQGSVRVKRGERVAAGDPLGLVGVSGAAAFPHLELVLRRDGAAIDPFTGRAVGSGCMQAPDELWSPRARTVRDYRAGGLLDWGFTDRVPELVEIEAGGHRGGRLGSDADAIVFWGRFYGLRAGDAAILRILKSEGGELVADTTKVLDRARAQQMWYIGKRRPPGGWSPGRYQGELRLVRGGQSYLKITRELVLE